MLATTWWSVLQVMQTFVPLASWARNVVRSVAGQSSGIPQTANNSLSTPWTAFTGGVNAVAGNVSLAQGDLTIPSVGFATKIGRAYNSAAADLAGPFGYGWFWSFGVRVVEQGSNAVVIREDGRSDTYVGGGGTYTPPAGIYDTLVKNSNGSWTLTRRDQVRFELSASGQLQRIVDSNSNTLTVTYAGTVPSGLTDTAGRSWTFQADGTGRITSVADPAGRTVAYQYNVAGDLTRVTDPLGKHTQFAYDGAHRLMGVTDANNHTSSYAYDGSGKVTSITDPASIAVAVGYNAGARTVTFTDQRGSSVTYTSDTSSRVTGITDATDETEAWAWDAGNNRVSVTDRNGGVTTSTYDARGNALDVKDAANGHVISTYDAGNRPLTRRDQLNRTTTLEYDARGNLTSTTNPASQTTSHAYDAKGQRTSTTDANNHTTTFAYDPTGNRTSVTNAVNKTATATFDAAGRVLTETDPDGRTTTLTYDAAGRVLTVTDGAGGVARTTYDAVGNRLTSVDPRGHATTYEYDSRDLLTRQTDADGKATISEYDAVRNRTKVTDALGKVTLSTYDGNNRLTSVKDPNNNTVRFEYDPVGNQTKKIDQRNHPTDLEYDALNRLKQVTDARGGRVQYEYDAVGNRTKLIDPLQHETRTTYDALNRPLSMIDPLTKTYAYQYDNVGNLTRKTSAKGEITTYEYDNANQLTRAIYPEGTVTYVYDGAGNRVSMTDLTGTTAYQYDGARRLTRNAAPNGTVLYDYDAAGNLTRLSYPGGNDVTYQYDELSRVVGVTDWNGLTSGFGYDANSRRVSASHPNGTRANYGYDNGGRLTSIQWTGPGGASVAGLSYTYDATGNKTRVVDASGASNFTYDEIDRLTGAAYGDGRNVSYEYDAAGNRTRMVENGQSTFYNFNAANQLVAVGGQTLTWDDNGNILSYGTRTYRWDSQSRLVEVKDANQNVVTQMAYDGNNRRVSRLSGGQKNDYVFDEHAQLARVAKESNQQRSQLYGLNGEVIWDATSDQGQLYYHQDAIGSTVAMTKADGTLAGTRQYDVFGAPRNPAGTLPGSFWFAGEQYDQDSGLIYLRARYYDPALGRFLSVDPKVGDITDTQSLNSYAYARNNPLRYTDPSGQAIPLLLLAVVAIEIVDFGVFVYDVEKARHEGNQERVHELTRNEGQEMLACMNPAMKYLCAGWNLAGLVNRFSGPEPPSIKEQCVQAGGCENTGIPRNLWPDECLQGWCSPPPPNEILQYQQTVRTTPGKWPSQSSSGSVKGVSTGPKGTSGTKPSGAYGTNLSMAQIMDIGRSNHGREILKQLGVPGGAFVALGEPPRQPTNHSPYDWFLSVGDAPTLQWTRGGSPDGHTIVASKVRVYLREGRDAIYESPWIPGTSHQPIGIQPGVYSWVAIDMDDRGLMSAESDRWNFSVDSAFITFTDLSFQPASPSDAEQVTIRACTNGQAGVGITLRVSVNHANDGSTNGPWSIVGELGVPCFNEIDAPRWQTLPFTDGTHRVRVEAHGSQEGWDGSVTREATYTLNHRRPASPELRLPKDGAFQNSRDVIFSWRKAVNTTSYRLRASLNPDPSISPVLDQMLDPATLTSSVNTSGETIYTYPRTLDQDYPALYWSVTAVNDVGVNESGRFKLGVDRVVPTAAVNTLAAQSAQDVFLVRWTSRDEQGGSGIACANLEVREGADGNWTDWFACNTGTFSLFQGRDGVTYYFRARAKDVAGNFGSFSASPNGDASITVNVAAASVWWNGLYLSRRPISVFNSHNGELPTGYPVRMRLDGSTTPRAVDVFDKSVGTNPCDDLRVVFGDTTELDRLVLTCSSSLIDVLFRTHVAIPATTLDGTGYALYYNNTAAGVPPADRNDVLYPAIDSNTLRAYDMLEGSGLTLRDASLNNNGSMNGALGWDRQGKFGPAVVVPGDQPTGPAIDGGAAASPSSAFTVELWLKRTAPYGASLAGQTRNGHHARWAFDLDDRLKLVVWPWVGAGSADVRSLAPVNGPSFFDRFRHLAVTFDGANEVRFYIDGQLDVARTLSQSGLAGSASPLQIAASGGDFSRLGGLLSGFYLSSGVRTDFSYAQFANVTTEPTVSAGPEQILTNALPTATPTMTPTVTPTVGPDAVNGGTGANGPLTVSSPSILNNLPTTANGAAGSATLTVGSTASYGVGDEVLIHQTRGNGLWEFAQIQAISGGTFTLAGALTRSYGTGAQVVRVPNYTNVTVSSGGVLSPSPWDGSAGGLMAFRANGTLRIQSGGRIDANGLGYRGGAPATSSCSQGTMAQQGEGHGGVGINSNSRNTNGGGGGRQTAVSGGGGGGGYGGGGGSSQWGSAEGGAGAGNATLSDIHFGGGGGGASCGGGQPAGGPGAGAIMIVVPTLLVESGGSILANGASGSSASGSGAGGGAGGAILLRAGSMSIGSGRVLALGGAGGGSGSAGGSGGDGRIRLEAVQLSGSTLPAASLGAIAQPTGPTYTPTPTQTSTGTVTTTITSTPTVTLTPPAPVAPGWVAQASGVTVDLNSISSVDATTAWAVGNDATILKTTNGGASWVPQTAGVTAHLLGVAAVDANTAWIVGQTSNGAVILKTTNGGTSWTNQPFSTDVFRGLHILSSVAAANANVAWIVGPCGAALMTTNGGATWNISPGTPCRTLNQVVAIDPNTAWATGQGAITSVMTNGVTWTPKPEHADSMFGIGAVSTAAWVAGAGGAILKSTDAGNTWTPQNSGTTGALWQVDAVDANTVWVIGPQGTGSILKTSNGGTSWQSQATGISTSIWGISAVDASTVWVVGANGTILKTTSGGQPVTVTPTPTVTLTPTATPTGTPTPTLTLTLTSTTGITLTPSVTPSHTRTPSTTPTPTPSITSTPTPTTTAITRQLTVVKTGAGTGTVTSSPSGITCGQDCDHAYSPNTVVTLTATAASGSTFAGWSGAGAPSTCTVTPVPTTCQITMNAAKSLTATFNVISPPVGGRGFGITPAATSIRLSWTGGTGQAGYVLVRTPSALLTALATATSHTDPSPTPGTLNCYMLVPFNSAGASLGNSEFLCAQPGLGSPSGAPSQLTLRLNESNTASLNWVAPGGQAAYYLLAIPLDGRPVRYTLLPPQATSAIDDTGGALTCYMVLSVFASGTPNSDLVCGIPGTAAGAASSAAPAARSATESTSRSDGTSQTSAATEAARRTVRPAAERAATAEMELKRKLEEGLKKVEEEHRKSTDRTSPPEERRPEAPHVLPGRPGTTR